MRVRVHAPAFADHGALDDKGFLELPEGAALRDVYRRLRINPLLRPLILCAVNYKLERPSCRLADGDVISFFSAAGGG